MEVDSQRLQRVGAKYSLMCAGFGVLIAALITTVLLGLLAGTGLHEILLDSYFQLPIVVGLVSLGVSAWLLGRVSGVLIGRFHLGTFGTALIGVALALSCLVVSVSAAFTTHFFVSRDRLGSFDDYIIGPAIGMIEFGFIPAVVLGLVFSALIRTEKQ